MSRFPAISTAGEAVPASIFSRLREHLLRFQGDVIPLQIGDTHLSPPAEAAPAGGPDVYAYGAPAGWQPLVDALAADARTRRGFDATVQVTCGATHALSCAMQALCDPGDEVLLLTPHWPLIRGIALGQNVVPIQVSYDGDIEAAITPRTTALYFATPNNPDGAMLSAARIAELAAIAARHDLWIFADEVYEHYAYDAPHVSIAALPEAAARTVTVFSFAKSYAQAGLRVGYLVTRDPRLADTIKKLVNHSVYNVPVTTQRAALAAMQAGAGFLVEARERYRAARDRARGKLAIPTVSPPGGAYLWVDFGVPDCMPVLEKIAAAGVLLAPGHAFSSSHAGFARLCFTGVDEARLDEGIERINGVIRHVRG